MIKMDNKTDIGFLIGFIILLISMLIVGFSTPPYPINSFTFHTRFMCICMIVFLGLVWFWFICLFIDILELKE